MQKKTFDPRCSKVTNPFVQAYLEKQQEKARPIGDRQVFVNIIFSTILLMNVVVLGMVVWSSRATLVPELTGTVQQETAMGEAMAKIKQLEISLQNMRSAVEYHKNAYFKIEQEHETMKAAVARAMPTSNTKEMTSVYPAPMALNDGAAPNAEATTAVQAAREAAVAAQLNPQTTGQ